MDRLARYQARVTFPDPEDTPITLMAVITADPEMYRQGLQQTYETGTVEIWEVDDEGNPVLAAAEATEARETQTAHELAATQAEKLPGEQEPEESKKPPPSMAQLFNSGRF